MPSYARPEVRRRPRLPALVCRRTLWWPTAAGWVALAAVVAGATILWCLKGEDFLALTDRPANDVLVVEGWIGNQGIRAAAAEFLRGKYHRVVATGGMTSERWDDQQWSYAAMAQRDLIQFGVPPAQILVAVPRETKAQRTFESALAVRQTLTTRAIHARAVTVFTLGPHARRSRLVFAKVLRSESEVGVIAWRPPDFETGAWWQSSDRAEDFLKESVGYLLERICSSGRVFNFFPRTTPAAPRTVARE